MGLQGSDCQFPGNNLVVLLEIKGKAVPLQAWSGPQGSRKLRFPDFTTAAQDSSKAYPPAAFNPQEILLVLISVRG